MKSLILYDEFGPGMGFSSMKESFAEKPYDGQEQIAACLKKGKKTNAKVERPTNKFTGKRIYVELYGMTDDEYTWISVLPYYVRKYNLRLPKEFKEKVLKG